MLLILWQQPRWSEPEQPANSSNARNVVIVRNRYVEISSSESDADASPQLGSGFKTGNAIRH
jgi:hypothetical protein